MPVGKDKHKGERYCFVCAIQGPLPIQRGLETDKAGMVVGSEWAFSPTRKQDHKGDYHKVFNGDNFTECDASIIILDNAKYHAVYGKHVPKVYKAKRDELTSYLKAAGVDFQPNETMSMLKSNAKAYIETFEMIEIERLALEWGHEILWTPPYHSDLQPIELVIKKCAKRCEDLWESVQQVDRQAEYAKDESQDSTSSDSNTTVNGNISSDSDIEVLEM
eukprot:scaffold2518_cov178-Amphora_coffeaeformis.AAC.1